MQNTRGWLPQKTEINNGASPTSAQQAEFTERIRAASKKRPIQVIFVAREPLPEGVFAIVRLGTTAVLPNYAIVSRRIDDYHLGAVTLVTTGYAYTNPDDDGFVTLTLYREKWVVESAKKGRTEIALTQNTANIPIETHKDVAEMIKVADREAEVDVPGIGKARPIYPISRDR